jgi:mRNA-degrading endonuclease toxin of MazEF toxin-antitoxin module
LRGEIWFVNLPTDPPDKNARPVVVVSTNDRNRHERANTVLVVPFGTSVHKEHPTHVYLSSGETGLEQSVLMAENITTVRKVSLSPAKTQLRNLSDTRIRELADKVQIAMGCSKRS